MLFKLLHLSTKGSIFLLFEKLLFLLARLRLVDWELMLKILALLVGAVVDDKEVPFKLNSNIFKLLFVLDLTPLLGTLSFMPSNIVFSFLGSIFITGLVDFLVDSSKFLFI